ncbi:MAG: hypothetical protein ACLQVJ_12625 [Syntrophobacteraceae bacterium]
MQVWIPIGIKGLSHFFLLTTLRSENNMSCRRVMMQETKYTGRKGGNLALMAIENLSTIERDRT